MKPSIDTNFAFAILVLVASVIGFVFWLDYENEKTNDPSQNSGQVTVGSAKNKSEDIKQPKNIVGEWDATSSKAYIRTEILTPEMFIDKIDKFTFESPTLSTEFYEQAHDSKDSAIGTYPCVTPGPFVEAVKCFKSEKIVIDDKNYLRQVNLGYDYTNSPWVTLTWTYFNKGILLLHYITFDRNTISEEFFDYDSLREIESEGDRDNISYTQLGINADKLGGIQAYMENLLATKSSKLDNIQEVYDVELVTKYLQDRNDAEQSADLQHLRDLSESTYLFVRYNVAKNINTPTDALRNLAKDENNYVKVEVKFNPSTPQELADTIVNPF